MEQELADLSADITKLNTQKTALEAEMAKVKTAVEA